MMTSEPYQSHIEAKKSQIKQQQDVTDWALYLILSRKKILLQFMKNIINIHKMCFDSIFIIMSNFPSTGK